MIVGRFLLYTLHNKAEYSKTCMSEFKGGLKRTIEKQEDKSLTTIRAVITRDHDKKSGNLIIDDNDSYI